LNLQPKSLLEDIKREVSEYSVSQKILINKSRLREEKNENIKKNEQDN
jgi:hypothetical protein